VRNRVLDRGFRMGVQVRVRMRVRVLLRARWAGRIWAAHLQTDWESQRQLTLGGKKRRGERHRVQQKFERGMQWHPPAEDSPSDTDRSVRGGDRTDSNRRRGRCSRGDRSDDRLRLRWSIECQIDPFSDSSREMMLRWRRCHIEMGEGAQGAKMCNRHGEQLLNGPQWA
jgi:hypothetical protein